MNQVHALIQALVADPATNLVAAGASPAQFDATKKMATMEAVQRALGNKSGFYGVTQGATVPATEAGKQIGGANNAVNAFSLPDSALLPVGAAFDFINTGTQAVTVSRSIASDTLSSDGALVSSMVVPIGADVRFVKTGVGVWWASGTGTLKKNKDFEAALIASGTQKLPSGLLLQWGTCTPLASDAGTGTVGSFPVAFPNACFQVIVSDSGGAGYIFGASSISATQFRSWARDFNGTYQNATGRFLAIGW